MVVCTEADVVLPTVVPSLFGGCGNRKQTRAGGSVLALALDIFSFRCQGTVPRRAAALVPNPHS
jgi:hypothetical protein